ncbi:MAG: radical SAM protein [Methanoregulaceae archaeon]|nr:radical SAM protein [Methanoregulaceae archaeon]
MKISEKPCRSALVRSGIPGIGYCINPYSGCGHGCIYCYASFMKRFLGTGEPWGSFVQVKTNVSDRLVKDLRKCRHDRVMLSSVTDPYQPVEEVYRLTRSCLGILAGTDLPVSILTKSDLVLRDLDLLKKFSDIEVGFSITTADDRIAEILEPGATPPSRRFAAIAKLSAAGIRTWVFIAPVIPGLGDSEGALREILGNARSAGALDVEYDPLNCYPSARSNLTSIFKKNWPEFLPGLEEACRNPAAWRSGLGSKAARLWKEYGYPLHRDEKRGRPD